MDRGNAEGQGFFIWKVVTNVLDKFQSGSIIHHLSEAHASDWEVIRRTYMVAYDET